jgi:serine/threonine protein kinase
MDEHLRLYDVEGLTPNVPPYDVVRQIWRGRTADIFLGLAPAEYGERKRVVIRRLRRELAQDYDCRATFFLQGRLSVRLRHLNLVETFEVRRDGDESYIVTEFLDGHALSFIRERPDVIAIPLPLHLRVLTDVLDGLQYLHDSTEVEAPEGIVHGDVRPENIFVTYDGETKLLHSGIETEEPANVAREKLSYMSPEHARGEAPDRRSDVFSVGIMLWEAVTGLRFWQDWPESAIYRRLCSQSLPVHAKWVPIAGRGLFDIAERALHVDPSERYPSAREMREAIEEALSRSADVAPPNGLRAYMQSALAAKRKLIDDGAEELTTVMTPAASPPTSPMSLPPLSPLPTLSPLVPPPPLSAPPDALRAAPRPGFSDEDEATQVRDETTQVRDASASVPPASVPPPSVPTPSVPPPSWPTPSIGGLALHLTSPGVEARRQRTYALMGVAAILCGGWVLSQALAHGAAVQRAQSAAAPACPPAPAAPIPAPPAALPSRQNIAAPVPVCAPPVTTSDGRPALPWRAPARPKRPMREDPWGI